MTPRHVVTRRLAAVERALAPPEDKAARARAWSERWIRRTWRLDDFTADEIALFRQLDARGAVDFGEQATWDHWRSLCQDDGERATLDGLRGRDEHGGETLLSYWTHMQL